MENQYEIRDPLGSGDGHYFSGYDHFLERNVVIKRLTPRPGAPVDEWFRESLAIEVKKLAALSHPNIVTLFELSEDESSPFVALEAVGGETLEQIVARGLITEADFFEVADQILDAFVAAGKFGIVHQGIKPSNIMVSGLPSGKFRIKILDFGLSRFSRRHSEGWSDEFDDSLNGIDFLAPEQLSMGKVDQRTDLYSIGCVLFFALTGEVPYCSKRFREAKDNEKILREIRPDLSKRTSRFLLQLISLNSADRPATALLAMQSLAEPVIEATVPIQPQPAKTEVLPAKSVKDKNHLEAGIAIVTGAVLTTVAVLWGSLLSVNTDISLQSISDREIVTERSPVMEQQISIDIPAGRTLAVESETRLIEAPALPTALVFGRTETVEAVDRIIVSEDTKTAPSPVELEPEQLEAQVEPVTADNFRSHPAMNEPVSLHSPDTERIRLALEFVTNETRKRYGRSALETTPQLTNGSQTYAEYMKTHRFSGHESESGKGGSLSENTCRQSAVHFRPGLPVLSGEDGRIRYSNESAVPVKTSLARAESVVAAWMNSREQKERILDERAEWFGCGISISTNNEVHEVPSVYAVQRFASFSNSRAGQEAGH